VNYKRCYCFIFSSCCSKCFII